MRRKVFALAATMIASFVLAGAAMAQQDTTPRSTDNALNRTGDALRNAGDRLSGSSTRPSEALAPDVKDIRETLKDVTDAALTKKGFDNVVDRFVDADRNRLGKDGFPNKDHPTLDGRIAQFQKDWQARYNQEFKIKDRDVVFGDQFALIVQSKVGDEARLAGEKTVVTETGKVVTRDENRKMFGGDTNLEPGRKIATATISASHGLPEITVPLIHEAPDRWKIDVPDTYSGEQMHDALLTQLTYLDEHKDQWPANVDDAYRMVAHRVLMAVLNIPIQGNNLQPGQIMNQMQRGNEPANRP